MATEKIKNKSKKKKKKIIGYISALTGLGGVWRSDHETSVWLWVFFWLKVLGRYKGLTE